MRDLSTCIHRVKAGLPLTAQEYAMVSEWADQQKKAQDRFATWMMIVVLTILAGVLIYGHFFVGAD